MIAVIRRFWWFTYVENFLCVVLYSFPLWEKGPEAEIPHNKLRKEKAAEPVQIPTQ